MSSEEKINVVVRGDANPARISFSKGVDHILLVDQSSATFRTTDPTSFVRCVKSELKNRESVEAEPIRLFGDVCPTLQYSCELWEEKAHINQHAIAELTLDPSAYAKSFIQNINIPHSLDRLNSICKTFLKHDRDNIQIAQLLAFSKNCQFSTITEYEQSYDDKGQYKLNINKSLKDGKFSVEVPETVVFTFPLFESPTLRDKKVSIPVSVVITHATSGDGKVTVTVMFECIGAVDDLMVNIESFMKTTYLGDFEDFLFSGNRKLNKTTNESLVRYDPVQQI